MVVHCFLEALKMGWGEGWDGIEQTEGSCTNGRREKQGVDASAFTMEFGSLTRRSSLLEERVHARRAGEGQRERDSRRDDRKQ